MHAAIRRCWLAVVLAVLMVLLGPGTPAVQAGEQWCESDPLVVITTPDGARFPLYVTNAGVGLQHLVAVQAAVITYSTVATGTGPLVRLEVTIPGDLDDARFETRTSASTGPVATGTVFANATGFSGQPMKLTFALDVP